MAVGCRVSSGEIWRLAPSLFSAPTHLVVGTNRLLLYVPFFLCNLSGMYVGMLRYYSTYIRFYSRDIMSKKCVSLHITLIINCCI